MTDLQHQIENLLGKNRRQSTATQYKNRGQIKRLCKLIQRKYGLENIKNLKTKHVTGAIQDLKNAGKSPTTLASYATAARTIAYTIGKQNIVPRTNRELGISRRGDRLKPVITNVKHLRVITNALYARDEWLGLASEMREKFGLRVRESLLSHEIKENALVVKGAKGGRPRTVPIRTEDQRELLQRIQNYINLHDQRSLIPNRFDLKKGLKYQANALEVLGANKKNATHAHAARHYYAQQLAEMGLSKRQISEELGHGREEVVSHYIK